MIEKSWPGNGPAHISTIPLKVGGAFNWAKSISSNHEDSKEGGPGSGRHPSGTTQKAIPRSYFPHPTVDDAISRYNARVKSKLSKASVKKSEADSGSANTAVLRDKKKESGYKALKVKTHFKESDAATSTAAKFKVVLIQEGLGNFRDCYFYTKDCLKNAVSLFEGAKCYADHPDDFEEAVRPERCVRDILGHFEDVKYVEDQGRGAMEATLCLLEGNSFDWAKSLLVNCLEYASKYEDSDFVGLSINAQGEASEVSIQEFMQSQAIADPVKAKLQEAIDQGIETIRPVTVLKDATSCDLVTEAGAGGKILTMMERDRKPMKKKLKEAKHEAEAHEAEAHEENEAKEKEGHEADGADDGAKSDHSDEDQDKALFAKMIKQYLGDDAKDVDQDEAMELAHEAYEAHKGEGMQHEEAYEAAGKHLKMSMKIGKSMKQKKEGAHHEEEGTQAHEESQTPPPSPKGDKNKESMASQLIKANAEIAKLRESFARIEMKDYLNKKLETCGKSADFIKLFREALGTPKSKAHIDTMYGLFEKAYSAGQKEETSEDTFVFTEKTAIRESSGAKVISLADCMME